MTECVWKGSGDGEIKKFSQKSATVGLDFARDPGK